MRESTPHIVILASGTRLSAAHHAVLARGAYTVHQAASVAEAHQWLVEHPASVVVLCARSVAETVAALAQSITQAGMPARILVVAQRPTVRGATAAMQAGAFDYLSATASPSQFSSALRRALAAIPAPAQPAYAPLPARSQTTDDLISLVSHELRTPLMAINGYLEILQKYHDKIPPDKAQDFINRSLQATGELAYLSEMLVQVLQCEAGRHAPRGKLVALAPVVVSAVAQCDAQADRHAIITDVAPDARVWADPMALQQVIRNLVSNAVKYSPQGGTITISAVHAMAGMVEIVVRDEGIGMTPEQIGQLFQRFSRVHDAARWPEIRGTGLGLYICRQLVTTHGGAIWAESEPGKGSTFHVRWPVSPARRKHHPSRQGSGRMNSRLSA